MKILAFVFLALGAFSLVQVISTASVLIPITSLAWAGLLAGLAFWAVAGYFYFHSDSRHSKPVYILSWIVIVIVLALFVAQFALSPTLASAAVMELWLFIAGQAFATFYLLIGARWRKPSGLP